MLPIRDVNPTLIRPLVTWAIVAMNLLVFLAIQPPEDRNGGYDAYEFALRNAAIACEVTTGEPLSIGEIESDRCIDDDGDRQLFPGKNVWLAVVTSMFLHAGLVHILGNMWSLWIFGNNVEEAYGHLGFLLFYLAAGLAATLGFVLTQPAATVPLVGASGAIAGVMGAYLVLFPRHQVLTLILFRAVAVPAVAFLALWFFSQFLMAGGDTGIAWEAHVAGFAFGVVVTLPQRERLLARLGVPEYA